ncbi:MAG: flagellar hook assembly protein FlgD [Rhizobiaceae bacterium]|nr:flagellar hook assembly protein FlgD [Rhizobiaceae bacterium]
MEISYKKDLPAGYTPQTNAQKTAVDYQSFLRLLVAQMKNQDPTNPMDSTQYVAQLASFSQVEQSVQINGKLDQLLQSSALSQADDLIGNQITSADGKTTGIVSEVRLTATGLVAVLQGGGEVTVTTGVTVRAPTTTTTG